MPDTDTTALDNVTLSVDTVTVGERYMLAPNSTMADGGRVFFNNTEPIEVEATHVPSRYYPANVEVRGVDDTGSTRTQHVDPRFLSPLPQSHGLRLTREQLGDDAARWESQVTHVTITPYTDGDDLTLTLVEGGTSPGWEFTTGHLSGTTVPESIVGQRVWWVNTSICDRLRQQYTEAEPVNPRRITTDRLSDEQRRRIPSRATAITLTDHTYGGTHLILVESQDNDRGWAITQREVGRFNIPAEYLGQRGYWVDGDVWPQFEALVNQPAVAEHGTTPEWPVRECTHRHVDEVHYHVTEGGEAFNPGSSYTYYNPRVHEEGGMHTEQGVRYARGRVLAEASQVRDTLPEPVPDPVPSIPPEEVLRRLNDDDDVHPDVNRMDAAADITNLLAEVQAARSRVDEARQERAQWLDRLIERSRQVADDEEWCSVYDDGMRELGLPTRHDREPETEEITVTATVEISVNFDDGMFDEWFENMHGISISSRSNSADFTFTIDVETTATVDEGECACDDDHDWEDVLPDWVTDHGYDWEIERTGCSND